MSRVNLGNTPVLISQVVFEGRSESIFSLVHSDVWGPSGVSSPLGFRYFVSFIDDFSRCTWVFLM